MCLKYPYIILKLPPAILSWPPIGGEAILGIVPLGGVKGHAVLSPRGANSSDPWAFSAYQLSLLIPRLRWAPLRPNGLL